MPRYRSIFRVAQTYRHVISLLRLLTELSDSTGKGRGCYKTTPAFFYLNLQKCNLTRRYGILQDIIIEAILSKGQVRLILIFTKSLLLFHTRRNA